MYSINIENGRTRPVVRSIETRPNPDPNLSAGPSITEQENSLTISYNVSEARPVVPRSASTPDYVVVNLPHVANNLNTTRISSCISRAIRYCASHTASAASSVASHTASAASSVASHTASAASSVASHTASAASSVASHTASAASSVASHTAKALPKIVATAAVVSAISVATGLLSVGVVGVSSGYVAYKTIPPVCRGVNLVNRILSEGMIAGGQKLKSFSQNQPVVSGAVTALSITGLLIGYLQS